ncbi:hypothetical protein HPB48_012792 [Haemaphysalis longicornis]|uniref:Uncharacterized protein n=1 Tax=Haemaphysalis longicornis TaxID=44386 RepID=A0A9J6FA97_HAELO|nr:hypothetical protein HPB48_012792 [Haemaphysalis longicornis]
MRQTARERSASTSGKGGEARRSASRQRAGGITGATGGTVSWADAVRPISLSRRPLSKHETPRQLSSNAETTQLRHENAQLRRHIAEQDAKIAAQNATINAINAKLEQLLALHQPGESPAQTTTSVHSAQSSTVSTPPEMDTDTMELAEARPMVDRGSRVGSGVEPGPKRRALENSKERRILTRLDHQRDRQDRVETEIKSIYTRLGTLESNGQQLEQAPGVDRARNRNITADRAARELTSRAAPQARSPPMPLNPGRRSHEDAPYLLPTPLEDYGTILRWYRDTRRRFPAPHPNLTRSEGTLYRQIQTDSVLTPVLGRHIAPAIYETSACTVCRATRGTLAHILQCTPQDPAPSSIRQLPVTVRRAITSSDYNTQKLVVQCVREALERQRVGGASPLGPSAGRLT